jgi:hypothetical protein
MFRGALLAVYQAAAAARLLCQLHRQIVMVRSLGQQRPRSRGNGPRTIPRHAPMRRQREKERIKKNQKKHRPPRGSNPRPQDPLSDHAVIACKSLALYQLS